MNRLSFRLLRPGTEMRVGYSKRHLSGCTSPKMVSFSSNTSRAMINDIGISHGV